MLLDKLRTYAIGFAFISLTCFILIFSSSAVAEHSDADFLVENSIDLPDLGEVTHVAEADSEGEQDNAAMSEQCRTFAQDDDADVSKVVQAGCEPTLAQMSKLMDNPVGNVAMLFTQFDWTRLKNGDNKKTGNQGLYTGILQFPKPISENGILLVV